MHHNDRHFVARWGAHLDQDDELAARVWDALLEDCPLDRVRADADVVVAGQPSGIGPAGDEARAVVIALDACGMTPATVDHPRPIVVPRLSGAAESLRQTARRRAPVPGAPWLLIPGGERDRLVVDAPAIVRVATARTATPLQDAVEVWAISPSVALAVVEAGISQDRVHVVAPFVGPTPLGPGGGGVLAALPSHAPALARATLAALRRLPASIPVRLVPTVGVRGLEHQVTEALPGAELLSVIGDEQRFARLAADADVVLAVDDDPFQRRALVGAATGAAPLTTVPDGPVAAVFGGLSAASESALAAALMTCLETAAEGRERRAATIADACGPRQLARLLGQAPAMMTPAA
jgi:hypothetical protein